MQRSTAVGLRVPFEREGGGLQSSGMGKLLVFGGMTGSGRRLYVEDILSRQLNGLRTLDDLW